MRKSAPGRSPSVFSQVKWGFAAIASPLVVTFLLYARYAQSIILPADWSQLKPEWPQTDSVAGFAVTARDLGGRVQFGVASALLLVVAVASLVLACFVIARRTKRPICALAIVALAGIFGITIAYLLSGEKLDLMRQTLERIKIVAPSQSPFESVFAVFHYNPIVSNAAGAILLAAFSVIALPAGENERTGAALRARMRGLEQITICSAVLLVVITAVNKTLIDWPQAFLNKANQEAYAYLAGAISTFWGTFGTIFLVSALVPAFISLRLDIAKAARDNGRHDMAASRWTEDNQLEFDFKSGLGAAIAAAAPMLTAPGIDLASKLLH
jgi:hypothetical protein